MNAALQIFSHEQYITNSQGTPEFIVIPVDAYRQLVQLLEDYGLGLAMREAEGAKIYSKEDALRWLDNAD